MEEDAPRLNALKTDKERFETLYEVSCAMLDEGMEKCGLMFGLYSGHLAHMEIGKRMVLMRSTALFLYFMPGTPIYPFGLSTEGGRAHFRFRFDPPPTPPMASFKENRDRFCSLYDVTSAIIDEGIEKCSLMFGIDYTMSNKVQGEKTFDGKSLHHICEDELNPYQEVISILGETIQPLDENGLIPAFGFGDIRTKGDGIFSLKEQGTCVGFREVLRVYNELTPTIKMYRPTNFAPLIHKAIQVVKSTGQYHILVIAADGQVNSEEATINAIVAASEYPLSIICIGVGDGPWGIMTQFDELLPKRKFDNFQFFSFHDVMSNARNRKTAFALQALMEIPDQYRSIQELGLLQKVQEETEEQEQE